MYTRALQWIARKAEGLGLLGAEQVPVFVYGLDSLLSSAWCYAGLLLLGGLLGQLLEMVLWIGAYTLLRQRAGGYHATTRWRCFVSSLALGAACLLAMRIAPAWLCLLICALGTALVFGFAPVQHPNHPLNPRRRAKQWRLSRIIVCAGDALSILCALWWPRGLAPLAFGMGAAAAMMALAAYAYRGAQENRTEESSAL